jgi:hypothetical protein
MLPSLIRHLIDRTAAKVSNLTMSTTRHSPANSVGTVLRPLLHSDEWTCCFLGECEATAAIDFARDSCDRYWVRSVVAPLALVATIGCTARTPPSTSLNNGASTGVLGPVLLAPWHDELGPCPSRAPDLGVTTASPGDVDGDGRPDLLMSVCDDRQARDSCVVQLCLTDAQGQLRLAASWMASAPEYVQAEQGVAPRNFEAYIVEQRRSDRYRRAHEFVWYRGDGYLSSDKWKCWRLFTDGTKKGIACAEEP